ncbi:MAG: AsmA-like C-terminal domain-containing protein [Alphaproteobacteria bacterium]|nr:AsmA-like C-terminal domain-containing protein [Alphaproteobacteria bacterium]MCB9929263.1 AsmA-like C-terminal domain-containing protein [Alphaproteobacteria bacterium]
MRPGLQWAKRMRLASRRGPVGWVVRILVGAMTVLVLAAVFVAWRTAQEPVSLRFAIPAIEQALSAADGSMRVTIGGFRLRREGLAFVLEAEDMTVKRAAGEGEPAQTLAVLPAAEISLSASAFVRDGILAPERVVAKGLVVTARRGPDGVELLVSRKETEQADPVRLTELRRLLETDAHLRHLKSVDLSDLTFRVIDPVYGLAWQTEDTSMRLLNDPAGFKWEGQVGFTRPGAVSPGAAQGGQAQWSLTLPPAPMTANEDGHPSPAAPARLSVQLNRLQPSLVFDIVPGLRNTIGWTGAVSGALSTEFEARTVPSDIQFALRVGEGRLVLPATGGKLEFEAARAVGHLRLADRALELDELMVRHTGREMRIRGFGALHGADQARAQLSASGLRLSWLAGAMPGMGVPDGIDLAVFADINATVRIGSGIEQASAFVRTEPGMVSLPGVLPEPLAVGASTLDLRIGSKGRAIDLRALNVRLPGQPGAPDIEIRAVGKAEKGGAGQIDLALSPLAVADLKRLWPIGVGEGGRVWVVDQVLKGQTGAAKGTVTFRLPDAKGLPEPEDVRLDLRMPLTDVDLVYWPPMPPATGVSANAHMTEKLFEADVQGGESGGMRITGGLARFTGIDKGKGYERTEVSFDIAGPARNLMTILDRPPLRFARYLDLEPGRLAGTVAGTLTAAFPPIADLAVDDIDIGATGQTRNLVWPNAAFGQDLTGANMRFDVDKTALKLNGKGALAGAPLTLDGDLRFAADAPYRSRFRLHTTLDNKTRQTLGFVSFPFSTDILNGPAGIDMTVTEQRSAGTVIDVAADLSKARLAFPLLDWTSPAGEYAGLNARVRIVGGKLERVDNFRLTAPQLSLAGDAEWAGAAAPTVRLSEFRLEGGTNLTLLARPGVGDAYRLSIAGPRLDARPLLKGLGKDNAKADLADPGDDPPLDLDVNIGAVQVGSGRPLSRLHGTVSLKQGEPHTVQLAANTEGGGTVLAELRPNRTASLSASDAGALLAALGVSERIDNGRLTVKAKMLGAGEGIDGTVLLQDGLFREAPFLMRLFGGGADLPGEKRAWSIDQLDTDFSLSNGILMLEEGRVAGGELGATFQGWIDLNKEVLDISGAIVPVYSVSRVLQAIPLIGNVLTGGEGLFAANYRATGSLEQPAFNVNPLTALAPGLLRRLFGDRASAPPGAKPATTPTTPTQPPDNFVSSPDGGR